MYGYYLSKKRFNREFYVYYRALLKNLEKTESEIREEQFEMLKLNLINAYENIPYYNKIFNETEFSPYKIGGFDDIKIIPFLDKDKVKNNYNILLNQNIKKSSYIQSCTSGTTGQKTKFLLPKKLAYAKNAAFIYRFYAMADISPMDKRVTIGGRRFTNKKPYWIYNIFENQMLLSTHHLNEETVDIYISKINDFNPKFIQGHPNSILYLAIKIINKNISITDSIKVIFTTGETLVEENRRYIERAFKVKVLQQYGSGESCFSAQETSESIGYMMNYEHGYVELIGNGGVKEVVATSLQNHVMPFIRYKIGDYVVPVKEEIKKRKYQLPYLFSHVIGRVDDMIVNANGIMVFPVTIREIMKRNMKDFTAYQFLQNNVKDYELRLIDEKKDINVDAVVKNLKEILGANSYINVTYVDRIISDGGKIRNIINKNKEMTLLGL
jgi:phenylacetate-CoA ligase